MSIKKMKLSWIVVKDIKEAIKFYVETVGLVLTEYNEQFGWAELSAKEGGALLGLAETSDYEPIPPGSNAIVGLTVDDLAKTKAEMSKKGVQFIGDVLEVPGIVKLQMFCDADGNKFQLAQDLI